MPFAETSDATLFYELKGRGEPLLLIAGLGSTCTTWDDIAPELERDFSLIISDHRGIGRSHAKRPPSTLRDYSADLLELLDQLQVDSAHVVGVSLGGIIAQRFAVDHPQRVKRLVLVSCAHRFGPYLREMARLLGETLRRFPRRLYGRTLEVLSRSPMFLDAHPSRLEEAEQHIEEEPVPRSAVARQLRCLEVSEPRPGEFNIHHPTLVIAGEYDSLIPACYSEQMAQLIPGSRYMLIRRAGHNPLAEHPERLTPIIRRFLRTGRVGREQPAHPEGIAPGVGFVAPSVAGVGEGAATP